jgi:two-component system sensor histidine kinase YesM
MKAIKRLRVWILLQVSLIAILFLCLCLGGLSGFPALLVGILFVVWIMIVIHTIYIPNKNLYQQFMKLSNYRNYVQHRLGQREMKDMDVGELANLVDHMVEEVCFEEKVIGKEGKSKINLLQSQISPHFLYNTLESIRGQAILDDNKGIADMMEALACFFRYSISRKGNLVSLRDELANIDNYMFIQRYRFNNRFDLEVVIDEEDEVAYDYLVPKLFIQPIIENAIFHGLEEIVEQGLVTIEIIVSDQNLMIIVSDNGRGMDEDVLANINHSLEAGSGLSNRSQRGNGIALTNTNERIKLLFGQQYGIKVYSTLGVGTDVEITLPIHEMD